MHYCRTFVNLSQCLHSSLAAPVRSTITYELCLYHLVHIYKNTVINIWKKYQRKCAFKQTWNESRKCMLLPANSFTAHFVILLSSGSGVVVVPGTNWVWCHPRQIAPCWDELLWPLVFLEALITVGSVLMNILSLLSVLCHL